MVIFKLEDLLLKNKMSRYKLEQLTNWNHKRVKALCKGKVKVITHVEIETLCTIFNCTLTDIVEFKKEIK